MKRTGSESKTSFETPASFTNKFGGKETIVDIENLRTISNQKIKCWANQTKLSNVSLRYQHINNTKELLHNNK